MQNSSPRPYGRPYEHPYGTPYGEGNARTGTLVSSENEMMAELLALSLGQSLTENDLTRYERLCQAAEHVGIAPHALPKEHMVRDFTQWFHGWLVQNEELLHRQERAQATYDALTAAPIVMGPAAADMRTGPSQALVPVPSHMPVCCGE